MYEAKNSLTNFRKDWNKFLEIFHRNAGNLQTHNPTL